MIKLFKSKDFRFYVDGLGHLIAESTIKEEEVLVEGASLSHDHRTIARINPPATHKVGMLRAGLSRSIPELKTGTHSFISYLFLRRIKMET